MTEQVNAGLMRKLSAGQGEAGNAPRSVLRALRLALARAADDRLNLPLTVIGAKQATRSPADLGGLVRDDWLLLMFASDHGGPAAFCLDPGCVSAVLQKQTIGVVTADPPQPRVFTDTDAAMAVPLVEGLLQRAQKLVEAPEDLSSLSGFEFSARAKDLRSLTLVLSDDTYRVFDLTIELAGGARQGQISVVLPDHPEIEESEAVEMVDHGPSLDQSADVIRAELQSVICRVSLPLSDLSTLQIGDVLPLSSARLDRTEITTIERARMAVGRLGQCGGMRAVRINEQMQEPALLDAGQHSFLESSASTDVPPLPASHAVEPVAPMSTGLTVPPGQEMTLARSDQMVAEISQLAGLDGFEDEDPAQ